MADNPYSPPETDPTPIPAGENVTVYAGFWVRFAATMIDSVLMMMITTPLLLAVYGSGYFLMDGIIVGGWDFLISWLMPAVVVIVFWRYKSATPGKMALKVKIVDANTGEPPSTAKLIGRYFAYFVAVIPVGLGFLWVAFDERKQGWHDKLAGTVLIRQQRHHGGPIQEVTFES